MFAPADSMQFVEYDQRAHRLETLASFTFWVQSTSPFSCRLQAVPADDFQTHSASYRALNPRRRDWN